MARDRLTALRCLNHKLPGLRGVYNTHDYFAERKAALEAWTRSCWKSSAASEK
jgi:hypothetical protein